MRLAVAMVLVLVLVPARAEASPRPIPRCAWTPAAQDALVRMVQVETEADPEHLTHAWALARRWRTLRAIHQHETFAESIVSYSQVLKRLALALILVGNPLQAAEQAGRSPRQRRILSETWRTRDSRYRRHIRDELQAWYRGERPDDGCQADPRGPAFHWRAPQPGDSHNPRLLKCPNNNNAWFPPPAYLREHFQELMEADPPPGTC